MVKFVGGVEKWKNGINYYDKGIFCNKKIKNKIIMLYILFVIKIFFILFVVFMKLFINLMIYDSFKLMLYIIGVFFIGIIKDIFSILFIFKIVVVMLFLIRGFV